MRISDWSSDVCSSDLPVAPIDALHRLCALAHGGADAVHRRVAAADDDDVLAFRVHRAAIKLRDIITKALAVGRDQIIERLHHAVIAHTRRLDLTRLVNARRDQQRIMPGTKLLERRVAAHLEIEMNVDARLPQPLDPPRSEE